MSPDEFVARYVEGRLSHVRSMCYTDRGLTTEQAAEISAIADMMHNVGWWLLGQHMPTGEDALGCLVDFARYTHQSGHLLGELEAAGFGDRAESLRQQLSR